MRQRTLLLLACATLYSCCPSPSDPQPTLPEDAENVQIEYSIRGGMIPFPGPGFAKITLGSPNSESYEITHVGPNPMGINGRKISFPMSQEEVLAVYHFLRENKFHSMGDIDPNSNNIVMVPVKLADASYEVITVHIDGKTFEKESWRVRNHRLRFRRIVDEIKRVASAKTAPKKIACEILLEESLWKEDRFVSLASPCEGSNILDSEREGKKTLLTEYFFSGEHNFTLELSGKGGKPRREYIRYSDR